MSNTLKCFPISSSIRITLMHFLLITLFVVCLSCKIHAQISRPPIHDPVLIKQDSTYYLFGTGWGISVWTSKNMDKWNQSEPVFDEAPGWVNEIVPGFKNHIWAPDISYHNGTYYLYYSISAFGKNTSAIGVATNRTLNPEDSAYRWIDHGPVVQSVPGRDMWNAIDPNLTFDDKGTPWLSFGSYWMGLKIVQLQDNLTEIATKPQTWHTIAARHRYWKLDEHDAGNSENGDIEAPFIFKKNEYYYLFASWDQCCSGKQSTYKVIVGRSKKVTGPYLDRSNKKLILGGGTLVVKGNDEWAGVGHNSAYTFNGTDYLVFHGYDISDEGNSKLFVRTIQWDEKGWPSVKL